jgi:hypothetical protein
VALQARSLVVLHLQRLDHPRLLVGAGDDAQPATRVGEHQSGRRDIEQLDAAASEVGEQRNHVEVGDQRVRQRDEGIRQAAFSICMRTRHCGLLGIAVNRR